MEMKKLLVLIVAALLLAPVSAMAGMNAFMDMDELSNSELASTTGQTGITINTSTRIISGWIAWGDDDGCLGTTINTGYLVLGNITAATITTTGLTIDVCTSGGTTWLTIGVPQTTVSDLRIAGIYPTTSDTGPGGDESLGSLRVTNLVLGAQTLQITSH
jgi:hypothetical protein